MENKFCINQFTYTSYMSSLSYFVWADQRVQQCYKESGGSYIVIETNTIYLNDKCVKEQNFFVYQRIMSVKYIICMKNTTPSDECLVTNIVLSFASCYICHSTLTLSQCSVFFHTNSLCLSAQCFSIQTHFVLVLSVFPYTNS